MGKTDVCAVVVSYHSPEKVITCINSLSDQVDEIIVIDNSTDRGLNDAINALNYPDNVSFVFNGVNRGLAAALNQGLRYSLDNKYEWTLFLDQDSILSENMVSEMMNSYENLDGKAKEETAVVVSMVLDRDFKEVLPAVITTRFLNRKLRNPAHDSFVHFHITSGSMIRNEVIKDVGWMNEYLFIDYIDFDYCFRILDKNYKILLSKNALLYHSLAEKKQKLFFHFREHSNIRVYYQTRNRLFALFKYGRKYRSFLYAESFRFISKLFKIIIIESDKGKKLNMYFKGVTDFLREYKKIFFGG